LSDGLKEGKDVLGKVEGEAGQLGAQVVTLLKKISHSRKIY